MSSWPPSRMSVFWAYDERCLLNISLLRPLIEAVSCVGILKYFFFVLRLRKKNPPTTPTVFQNNPIHMQPHVQFVKARTR